MKTKHMTTLDLRKSIGRSPLQRRSFSEGGSLITYHYSHFTVLRLRLAFLLIPLLLGCFGLTLAPKAFGVLPPPPPDGGYPGQNTAEGDSALFSLTTGIDNTALGFYALYSNTTGHDNTANGVSALVSNTIGTFNTAMGVNALKSNTDGGGNTANGVQALYSNTTGYSNTANGVSALYRNTIGHGNTATGVQALSQNNTGRYNTGTGADALSENTTGYYNTANGVQALFNNTTGHDNTANGVAALYSNTTGIFNTANGDSALNSNTRGLGNTAIGAGALFHNTTGRLNIGLGGAAGQNLTTGSNNIDISNPGVAAESNIIRVGNEVAFTDLMGIVHPAHTKTFIAGIHGTTASGAVTVYVNSSGQLGTLPSSVRFKHDIHSMDKASEVILALKPVTFHYKKELDPEAIPQFGLVAEEVEKVNPDLVVRDKDGKPYSVRYDQVNAMLLNEFLKANRKIEAQQKQIEALTAGLQKVSAQLELTKFATGRIRRGGPAPQTVLNDQ
jgi:hypothetical protein